MRVRAAREVDAAELTRLVHDAFAAFQQRTGIRPAPVDTDWATVASAHGARVATMDERVVGVIVLWPHPDHVLVETVAVAPDRQGAGIGTLLLDLAERQAIESGVNVVRLYTNEAMTDLLGFYPRRGFVETGRRTEQGYARVHFEKRLDPGA